MCVYMFVYECTYPQKPEEGVRSPGVGATGGCDSLHMGTDNQTLQDQ